MVAQEVKKRLRDSLGIYKLRCFSCYRVAEARKSDLPVNGEDSRYFCKVCGFRSVRLIIEALDFPILNMLKGETMAQYD